MKLKPGWRHVKLSDIAKIKSGSTPLRAEGERYFSTAGTPWVKTLDLNNGEIISTDEKITDTALLETSCSVFPVGTVLVAMYGGFNQIGRTGLLTIPAAINQALSGLILDRDKAEPAYILNYLNGNVKLWKKFAASSRKDPNITRDDVCGFPVLLPPLAEQKKIAKILSTWDNAISVTEKLLANSQQQKKALMQQLLTGKKRLLDENGVRFSGEWKRVKLGAIADMNSGGTPKSTVEEYYGGNIPWVSISDMTSNGKWIATTEKYLTELGLNSSSARIYPKNSVLYAMYASIGECSIAAVNLTSSQAILGIRPKDCLNYEFLYFYLTSLKEKIKLQGQQGTQSNLNAGMVKEFELDLPSIREQQKIAAVLSVADAEISTLEKKLACLRDEKKALMQQLLTGKRRVKVDEAVAE
ncbi:TPA: restriction endonuclease subunit S [Escherichia coli]|uniref:restriction endonuclease subunit S n=1 Tax=Escherichia coli TaxID=562 RepID=UPI000CF105E6|nr:restriction endonuclease subunit S [Escherichia coli]HDH1521591.1 restriction endonuclease subunit S [Klebsiella quasipneumoniae subsp. similipneumoniae]EHB8449418.1 restriction endonuclease subunit S [Escherichia coli]EHB8455964.1 restriction endonuclease subunit S [Escherichia coli]EKS5086945.1 restriction endonuclease subunit S [Escherichia coli]EMB1320142.1 restriction endonuclease subunit S [Escherichia coli]